MSERLREITSFLPLWQDKPRAQVVEEIASYFLETKRKPDPYYFIIGEGGILISPQTGKPIIESIEKGSLIGKAEYEAVIKIQNWTNGKDGGVAVWISPPFPGKYPTSKIIVSEIETNPEERRLVNRAILVNLDKQECVSLAKALLGMTGETSNFTSPEDLRSCPVFLDLSNQEWISVFSQQVQDEKAWNSIENGEDKKAKEEALTEGSIFYDSVFNVPSGPKLGYDDYRIKRAVEEAYMKDVLGSHATSCPPSHNHTGFEVFYNSSFKSEGGKTLNCTCPFCKRQVEAKIYEGKIHCPKCGSSAPYNC